VAVDSEGVEGEGCDGGLCGSGDCGVDTDRSDLLFGIGWFVLLADEWFFEVHGFASFGQYGFTVYRYGVMGTVRVLLCFVCAVTFIGNGLPGSSVVKADARQRLLNVARAEIGVREVGHNGGKRVAEYLACTGIKVPAPYCAAFVSFVFWKAGYSAPRTPWSPALFPASRVVEVGSAGEGLVFGIYFPELKRIAHVGLVESVKDDWVATIEGNTNPEGSRDGQGVYRRMRHKRTIAKYADWL